MLYLTDIILLFISKEEGDAGSDCFFAQNGMSLHQSIP